MEESDVEKNDIDLIGKNSDIKNCARNTLSGRISQNKLLKSELLSFLREVWFNNQKFATNISIFNIKYNHLTFPINKPFYLFHN